MDKGKAEYALDCIFAYDTGATDSGVHDSQLKQALIAFIKALDETNYRLFLSEFIREHFLSDEALKQGYGIDDVREFLEWLDSIGC